MSDFGDLTSFATRYAEAWCSQNPEAVAAFFAERGSLAINDAPPAVGRAAIAKEAQAFMSAFPDMTVSFDKLSHWDGKSTTVLNHADGCGHNGLALTKTKTFLLACTNDPGAIMELDMSGKQLRRWDTDSNGGKFVGGINDVVVTANGGA